MFILSGPYNSSFLGKTLKELKEPVFVLPTETKMMVPYSGSYETVSHVACEDNKLLSSLEDSISFLTKQCPEHSSLKLANMFKDKFLFRTLCKVGGLYNNFLFDKFDSPTIISASYIKNNPKVLKPTQGISSRNVVILKDITKDFELKDASKENPFLLEDYIPGIELAVDGYFDSSGKPVILNILQHDFFATSDVSDTLYWTTNSVVSDNYKEILTLLENISEVFDGPKNFPFHMECRKSSITGEYIPIEINPLRFAGYGTCEIVHYAYNINPYESFFKELKPNWNEIVNNNDKSCYGFVCLNKELSHRKVFNMFDEVLEYRFIPKTSDANIIVFFRTTNLNQLKDKVRLLSNI